MVAQAPSSPEGITEACARNAAALLREADILTQNGCHARACALAILALEEYAKAFLHRVLEIGFASHDCDDSHPGPPLRICDHVLTDHKSKHLMIGVALVGLSVLPQGFQGRTAERGPNAVAAVTEADRGMASLLTEASEVRSSEDRARFRAKYPQLTGESVQVTDRVKRWEGLKQRSLYVDEANGIVEEPSVAIGPEPVGEIRKAIDQWLLVYGRLVTFPVPKEVEGRALKEIFGMLSAGSVIQGLPPRLLLCQRCQRERRRLRERETQNRAHPKGSENGSPEN